MAVTTTIDTETIPGKTIVKFTGTGSTTFTPDHGVTKVRVLVVGAGAGGSGSHNQATGGGGGGDVQEDTEYEVTPGTPVDVVVGAKGVGGHYSSSPPATDGGQSQFGTITANGGKAGVHAGNGTPPAGDSGNGNRGGTGTIENPWLGGGGAGAGGNGYNYNTSGHNGEGGPGVSSDITGTSLDYGPGGGGGKFSSGTYGAGGSSGVGGHGGNSSVNATNGMENRGAGGGGAGSGSDIGGDGSDGIVILQYDTPSPVNLSGVSVGTSPFMIGM